MNHTYYYTLLGHRVAGAPGGCTTTSRFLRFSSVQANTYRGYEGGGTAFAAAEALAHGGVVEVWANPGWPLVNGVTGLFLNEALTQPLLTQAGGVFHMENDVFGYVDGQGPTILSSVPFASLNDSISAGEPAHCNNLSGPFLSGVWVNSTTWQTVTLVTIDEVGLVPFPGGGLKYAIEGLTCFNAGTTLGINNCGQVTSLYAC